LYAKGRARLDRRTKRLLQRLKRGEVAIIDHEDLDSVSVEGLIERGAAAVVNASASISGRYPNEAPLRLLRAGIPVLDEVGEEVFERVREGEVVEVRDGALWLNGRKVAEGKFLTEEEAGRRLEEARQRLSEELERFVRNTLSYVAREMGFFLRPATLPELRTRIRGRHAVVVVRGEGYKEDLRAIRAYIEEVRPVLIAVNGGADALLEFGLKPDIIIGDMDSASERALSCGAELVVHAYPDGRAPGLERLKALGVAEGAKVIPAPGTSEDLALLLAYEKGASLIVVVGAHFSMVEFLSKGREGMSSTFLTRLRVGEKLVDAKGVSKLYRPRVRPWQLALLLLAGMAVAWLIFFLSPAVRGFVRMVWLLLGP